MADVQNLPDAVALLREIRFGSPDMAREAVVAQAIDAFLALPSVSPDLPADAPGEGQWRLDHDSHNPEGLPWAVEAPIAGRRLRRFGRFLHKRDAELLRDYLNALTSAPAPSSEALRRAVQRELEWLDHPFGMHSYDKSLHRNDCLACSQRTRLRAALAAEEAQS